MNEYNQYQQSNKNIWIIIGVSLVLVLIICLVVFFIFFYDKTIPEKDLIKGANIELNEEKPVKFILDDEEHTISLDSVDSDSATLIIRSFPIKVTLNSREEKKIDLDDDGYYDLLIKLRYIKDNIPNLYLEKIHEKVCIEDWDCDDWGGCTEQGFQKRNCTDLNNCGTEKEKPSEIQSCTYIEPCEEDWNCTEWTECVDEIKTRNCTDLNGCGTEEDKPEEEQDCVVEIIDCGEAKLSDELNNGTDLNCFIDVAEDCEKSKMLFLSDFNFLGILTKTYYYMELKGIESGKCIYYQNVISNSVEYTEELIQSKLNNGMTQEEIDIEEQELNETNQYAVGWAQYCKLNNGSIIKDMLENWEQGKFSSSDLPSDSCETLPPGHEDWPEGCLLNLDFYKLILYYEGASMSVSAHGFEDESKITWVSEDESIAKPSNSSGSTNSINAVNQGITNIIVTDTNIGFDCKVKLNVNITIN